MINKAIFYHIFFWCVIVGGIVSLFFIPKSFAQLSITEDQYPSFPSLSTSFAVEGEIIRAEDMNKLSHGINNLHKRTWQQNPGYFSLLQSNGSARSKGSEFIITDTGSVGIGINDPKGRLEVSGMIRLGSNAESWQLPNNELGIYFQSKGASGISPNILHTAGRIYGESFDTGWENQSLVLEAGRNWEGNADAFQKNQLVLKGNGNIGIGTSTPITKLEVAGGIRADTVQVIYGPHTDVTAFGAKGDGTTDSTIAFQTAINTAANSSKVVFIPAGVYNITADLQIPMSIKIIGVGREYSILSVKKENVSRFKKGILVLSSGEPSSILENFSIQFEQLDTNIRSSIIRYVPAIYAVSQPRFKIRGMQISAAYDGIDMRGNSGGANIDDLQISCFHICIDADGSYDEVYISKLRVWPFGLSSNLISLFFDIDTIGMRIGRVDGLSITDSMFINGKAIQFIKGSDGNGSFTRMSNVNFDTFAQIDILSHHAISITNAWFSKGGDNYKSIYMKEGTLEISNSHFFAPIINQPLIDIDIASNNLSTVVSMANNHFNSAGNDASIIQHNGINNLYLYLSNNHFNRSPHVSYSKPIINLQGPTRGSIMGNSVRDKGTGSGVFLQVMHDDHLSIIGNQPVGWAINLPSHYSSLKVL